MSTLKIVLGTYCLYWAVSYLVCTLMVQCTVVLNYVVVREDGEPLCHYQL